jgi:methyl-accepting chemotaxis protein
MMLGFLAFLWPAWMSWQGRRKLSGQIGELERGIYGRVVATEETDDYSRLQESVNRVSESLALLEREREERLAREEKTARQLCDVLESVRIGNFDRRFDPGKESPWAAAADSLNELALSLKEMREASDAERVLKRRSLQIPRDDFFVLEKLLRAEGGQVAGVLAEMPEDSPVRSFAEDLAAIGGGRREALEKIDERLRGIRESWNAVAGSVETREDDLEKEYEFIHETSSTVDEVSVAAKQSSQMVEYVFRASQRAMSTASEGRDLVSQSIDGMNLISEQVSAIAHHILGLSKKAQEVGNIVRAVGEVSKQTNLLALNAAIEAAGAGEHGKGFAVVAKEIRELAVKSSQSTQTIEKLIREMQDATNTAVLATEEGSKSVQSGVRTINFLNTSFGQILERSQEVVESAQQISTASQEQTTGARQVANSIGSIDKMMLASLRDLKEMKTQLGQFQELVVDLESLADTLTEERQRT